MTIIIWQESRSLSEVLVSKLIMKRVVSICIVVCASGVLVVAAIWPSRNQQSNQTPSRFVVEAPHQNLKTVNYAGVNFTFDAILAVEVKSETRPEIVESKWTDIGPEYPVFTFKGYQNDSEEGGTAEIRVFSISKFREVARKSSAWYNSVSYPGDIDLRKDFDTEVRILELLLANQPSPSETGRFLGRARGSKGCGEMPFLPMWEWCQAFATRPKYVSFKNGRGVFYLAHMDRETSRVTNADLRYIFQGITLDRGHYVSALFPVAAPFLPKNSLVPEVEQWNSENYLLSHKSKKYQNYVRPIIMKLNELPAEHFTPRLELIERLIQSLEVK
jgi:hypothetical protein